MKHLSLISAILIKCFVFGNLLITIFLMVGNTVGQDKTSNPMTVKKERISYLHEIEESLPPGIEKEFFLTLEESESKHRDLIEALGLFQYKNIQPFGTVQYPGKEPELTYVDWGATNVLSERLKLFWETTVINSNDSFRLLFFHGSKIFQIRPGQDCLIAATNTDYRIRIWAKCGFHGNLTKVSLEKNNDGYILKITTFAGRKEFRVSHYKITRTEITFIRQDIFTKS